MTAETVRERAIEVLVAHQRIDPSGCVCGPMRLGSSHPAHQADAVLAAVADVDGIAGVLLSGLHPHHDPDECSDEWQKDQADRLARLVVAWMRGDR